MPNIKKTKRKSSQPANRTSAAKKQKVQQLKNKRSLAQVDEIAESDNDDFVDLNVPGKHQELWRPLTASTQQYVTELASDCLREVLVQVDSRIYEDVEDILNTIIAQLDRRMKTLKAPRTRFNYKTLSQLKITADAKTRNNNEAQTSLDDDIDEVRENLEGIQAQCEELTAAIEDLKERQQQQQDRLHPVLKQASDSDELDVPTLPPASHDLDALQVEPTLTNSSKKLIKHLTQSQNKDADVSLVAKHLDRLIQETSHSNRKTQSSEKN